MRDVENNGMYSARRQLYDDTILCKKTSRILAAPHIIYLPMLMYGTVSLQDVMMDYNKAEEVFVRYHEEFQPDLAYGPGAICPCSPLGDLGCTYIRYPGKHFSNPNGSFQVLDREDGYMSPDEYLEYAEDPTGFFMRKLLPRHYSALKGLEMVNLSNAVFQGGLYSMIPMAFPDVKSAFEEMSKAGEKMLHYAQANGAIMGRLADMGWPAASDMAFSVPFDIFNDTLRGFLNTTMDMIEYPDELLAALKTATKIVCRDIREFFKNNPGARVVTFYVHNGMDMFMSREQFETFYWPGFKACIDTVIQCGGVPKLYLEDKYDDKMDIFAKELPVGKCIVNIINSDKERTKDLFAGKICISGGINGALLQYGTKEEVIADVKHNIDILAPGGGYIIDTDVSLDVAKPENLHALFEIARTYVKY